MKNYKKLFFRIVITLALFGYILRSIDTDQIKTSLSNFNTAYLPLILLCLIFNYVVSSLRWKSLLIFENKESASIGFLLRLYFVGSFFNNFLPTSVGGDIYKVMSLGKKINSTTNAFTATFMERFTGMISLVIISYVGLIKTFSFWIGLLPAQVRENQTLLYVYYVLILFGFWFGVIAAFYLVYVLRNRFSKVGKLYNSLMQYKEHRSILFVALATSFVVQLLSIFTQYFIFMALGYNLPFIHALVVFPVVTLASFFIPSINGLGVQDTLFIQFLGPVGVPSASALAGSILYHISRMLVSLIGGVFYAIYRDA